MRKPIAGRKPLVLAIVSAAVLVSACATATKAEDKSMSFFITSAGSGKGGDLGGLAGADALCQQLATAAGAGNKTWHAYLSTENPAVSARDRIGKGPWYNAKGVLIASNLDELHGSANKIDKQNGLNEKGGTVNGRGDTPNTHDILTGSTPDGRVVAGATCNDWTAGSGSTAMVGHFDRTGTNPDPVANVSWNSSHKTPGCDTASLARVGGGGLLYCFAVK
jgi:hypothetical protein